jgi:hypothetical protein
MTDKPLAELRNEAIRLRDVKVEEANEQFTKDRAEEAANRKRQPSVSFLVDFTKHRGFIPPDEKLPVEIVHKGGECRLQLAGLDAAILTLAEEHPDWSQTKIGAELGTNQSKVSRVLNPKMAA